MDILKIVSRENFLQPSKPTKVIYWIGMLGLVGLIGALVYATGGTKTSVLHLFYVPIILAGFLFSIPAAMIMGIICGLILGPWMPADSITGEQQSYLSWIIRTLIFISIGSFSGFSSYIFKKYLREQTDKYSTDQALGLPNYKGLENIFKEYVEKYKLINVLVIDINNLKELETAMGAINLDTLLNKISNNIKSLMYSDVALGYVNNLGFVLFVPSSIDISKVVERYQKHLELSHVIDNIPIYIESFYGVASYPEDGGDLALILKKARITIEYCMKRFVQVGYYDPKFLDSASSNVMMLHELDKAIKSDALSIAYQPKINLITGELLSVEALTRWHHPELGNISPMEFIPLTERTLLINPFTKWMITRTLGDLKKFHNDGIKIKLAINFSMKNFMDPSVLDCLIEKTKEFDIQPRYIEIEVTESSVSADITEVSRILQAFQDLGFLIAIDDFGTGQASQQYLFELPINSIKIDQMFTRSLPDSKTGTAIVKSAIILGEQLGFEVVAEGIENPDQFDKLIELGCTVGQGFGIARPMPPSDLKKWYTKRSTEISKPVNTNKEEASSEKLHTSKKTV